ncbi:MAG: TetR/AcrR family transcriptional regulator [Clostridia bacterium]|jgi:AcrR family transcriptional regulator|nr:TetR/AcrR family transcriptional regulator [Clostridia bacterium]
MDINTMSRRERKKLETKANILGIARHLFEEKGFENTSIEEITEKADVAKGTFFNYFTSKDSLMAGISEEEVEDILFYVEEELSDIEGSVKKIRMVLKRLLEDAIPYLHLTGRIMFSSIINTSEYPSPFYKINILLENLVKEGQMNGELTDAFSAENIATSILGSYYGVIFKWFELGSVSGTVSELECNLNILFKGISGPKQLD